MSNPTPLSGGGGSAKGASPTNEAKPTANPAAISPAAEAPAAGPAAPKPAPGKKKQEEKKAASNPQSNPAEKKKKEEKADPSGNFWVDTIMAGNEDQGKRVGESMKDVRDEAIEKFSKDVKKAVNSMKSAPKKSPGEPEEPKAEAPKAEDPNSTAGGEDAHLVEAQKSLGRHGEEEDAGEKFEMVSLSENGRPEVDDLDEVEETDLDAKSSSPSHEPSAGLDEDEDEDDEAAQEARKALNPGS